MASLHTPQAAYVLNQTESNVHCLIISSNFFFPLIKIDHRKSNNLKNFQYVIRSKQFNKSA